MQFEVKRRNYFLLAFARLSPAEKAASDFLIGKFKEDIARLAEWLGDGLTPEEKKYLDKRLKKTRVIFNNKELRRGEAYNDLIFNRVAIEMGEKVVDEAVLMEKYDTVAHELLHGIDASFKSASRELHGEGRAEYINGLLRKMEGKADTGIYLPARTTLKKKMLLDDIEDNDIFRSLFPKQPKRMRKWVKRLAKAEVFEESTPMMSVTFEQVKEGKALRKKIDVMIQDNPSLVENNEILKRAKELLRDVAGEEYDNRLKTEKWRDITHASVLWKMGDLGEGVKGRIVEKAAVDLWSEIGDLAKNMPAGLEGKEKLLALAGKWDEFRHGEGGRKECAENVLRIMERQGAIRGDKGSSREVLKNSRGDEGGDSAIAGGRWIAENMTGFAKKY